MEGKYNLGKNGIEIKNLSIPEGMELFYNIMGNSRDRDDVEYLIRLLDCNAYLIKLWAIFLRESCYSIKAVSDIVRSNNNFDEIFPTISLDNRSEEELMVLQHISSMYRFTGISDEEKRILSILALIPGVRFEIDVFSELLGGHKERGKYKKLLLKMVRRGWLNSDDYVFAEMNKLVSDTVKIKFEETTYFDLIPLFKNYLLLRYDENSAGVVCSYPFNRLLNLLLTHQIKGDVEVFVRNVFDNVLFADVYAMVAFSVGNKLLFQKIMSEKYGNLGKSITCVIGQGKSNSYALFYDGTTIVSKEVFSARYNEWKGQALWCWNNPEFEEQHNFILSSLICIDDENAGEKDYVKITKIAPYCFSKNTNIDMFIWQSAEDETGEIVGLETIGNDYNPL